MNIEIKVNGLEDRLKLCAILANNGVSVRVEKRKNHDSMLNDDSFLIIETNQDEE